MHHSDYPELQSGFVRAVGYEEVASFLRLDAKPMEDITRALVNVRDGIWLYRELRDAVLIAADEDVDIYLDISIERLVTIFQESGAAWAQLPVDAASSPLAKRETYSPATFEMDVSVTRTAWLRRYDEAWNTIREAHRSAWRVRQDVAEAARLRSRGELLMHHAQTWGYRQGHDAARSELDVRSAVDDAEHLGAHVDLVDPDDDRMHIALAAAALHAFRAARSHTVRT